MFIIHFIFEVLPVSKLKQETVKVTIRGQGTCDVYEAFIDSLLVDVLTGVNRECHRRLPSVIIKEQ